MHQNHNPKKAVKIDIFAIILFLKVQSCNVYEIFLPIQNQKVCGTKKVAVPTEWSVFK